MREGCVAGLSRAWRWQTYLTRAPLLLVLARRPLAPRLRLWLRLIPLAVLPALAAAADPGRSRPAG